MHVMLSMLSYDFCKEDYEELFGRVAGLKKNVKNCDSITIYFTSLGGMTQYVRPTADLIISLIDHFNIPKERCYLVVTDNVFSSGAFLLLELTRYCSYRSDVQYGAVFHKPIGDTLRNSFCIRALNSYYTRAINIINKLGIDDIVGTPDEFTVPINKFNVINKI